VKDLARRATAEVCGTAMLLVAVVGSGIMAERLSQGNLALALLANALATGGALLALILAFGPVSGAHFNPAVTLTDASLGGLAWREAPGYLLAQVLGAFLGVAVAHGMFELPPFTASTHVRAGGSQILGEAVATFGLLSVIWGSTRARPGMAALAVAAYITGAYWFTSSTSFANPAVTLARAATNTFAGIRPADVPGFLAGQAVGALAATALFRWLAPRALGEVAPGKPDPALPSGDVSVMTAQHPPFKVLFLCTGNSARSIFAEYFLERLGGSRFEAFSAGASPSGTVNPTTLKVLRERFNIDASDARSKSWDELRDVRFDFVITVCDHARETCPVWPGQPIVAHWGVDDPARFIGTPAERERFFYRVGLTLYRRLQIFTSLPLEQLDRLKLEKLTRDIGRDTAAPRAQTDRVS